MSTTTSEIFNKTEDLTKDFKNKVQTAEDRLENLSHQIGEKVGAQTSQWAHSAGNFVDAGREYIQENPIKGVAIAAASGLVLGSLLTMAFRHR